MELFEEFEDKKIERIGEPLSFRMRPTNLDEYFGQSHILGEEKLLRRAILTDKISSLIFYGPPGIGKTALANVISSETSSSFTQKNAVSSNAKEIRDVISFADKNQKLYGKKTILLLDEIHRFNKAQQDILMPAVEEGVIILIGTTTENPFFSVNSALLSRSQVFEFKPLEEEDLLQIMKNALKDEVKGLGKLKIDIEEDALKHIANVAQGDARKVLNALELAVTSTKPGKDGTIKIGLGEAEESIQKRAIVYDRDGDAHYDTISAYIKSMRGSDPDAALYWLAKMIVAGEDPRFIARRLIICASEDVGNADPRALTVAVSAMQAAEFVGFPEARIPLAQATVYVACAPKSNASYMAIDKAISDVEKESLGEVPNHLRDKSYKGADILGHGEGYKYAHDYNNHYVDQKYMPYDKKFYVPGELGYEKKMGEWIEFLKPKGREQSA